jgi:hypothetical protein
MNDLSGLDSDGSGEDDGGGMMGGPAGVWAPTVPGIGDYGGAFGGLCFMCGTNNAASFFNQQSQSFFGGSYSDIPGNNGLANLELQSEAGFLSSGSVPWYQSAVAGPGGITITLYINFWTPCSKGAAAGCLGQDVINLFQFLDPSENRPFAFDTSFANTVAAFGRAGIVPSPWDNKYNFLHDFNLRDSNEYCSFHVDLNSQGDSQRQVQSTLTASTRT